MVWGKSNLWVELLYLFFPSSERYYWRKHTDYNWMCAFILKCPVSPFSISDNFGHLLISSISWLSSVLKMLPGCKQKNVDLIKTNVWNTCYEVNRLSNLLTHPFPNKEKKKKSFPIFCRIIMFDSHDTTTTKPFSILFSFYS